jgi:transglutaminase-like putative cysteine protease
MANSSGTRPFANLPLLSDLWKYLDRLPKPVAEESILLRILVQALVSVGIMATDVAAGTQMSLWAVPVGAIGALWSWYRRKDRNVVTQFAIAVGMLIALFIFFGNLFTQLNDTRLVLAELLVHLQVLHSFDLPRRKDLGYSMIIGLILIGVAATLSQTLAFSPLLFVFLVIALPTLVLDYRSRLGLSPLTWNRKGKSSKNPLSLAPELAPKQLGFMLLVVLGLGMALFAAFPRVPGYQFRNFPVSAPPMMQEEEQSFQGLPGTITNPETAEDGEGEGAGTGGDAPSEGAGQMDETFYYGFNSKINQNLRGQLIPKVMLRVRSQAEGFWRVLGFDYYTGQGWEIRQDDMALVERPGWSYKFYLPRNPSLARSREVVQTYTVVEALPNLIPALYEADDLYFPTREVALDKHGALRSPLNLREGLTYTVISEVPYRDRSVLREASTNYSKVIRDLYLQIPPEIADRVRQKTEEALATSENPLTDPYEKALYLTQYLKQRYSLEPELPFFDDSEDLVESFLFKYQGGYPDHFSTTLTLMLRAIGIPARLAVGFGPGEFNPFTGLYVVRNTDAFALTEVYFPEYGWFGFDPIPGHPLIPPSISDYQSFTVLRQFWNWVAGWLPSPVKNAFTAIGAFIMGVLIQSLIRLWQLISNGWTGFFIGAILAIALSFFLWVLFKQWQQWRRQRWLSKLHPMERIYQEYLAILREAGYPKHPAQTPQEYAHSVQGQYSSDAATVITEIPQVYVQWRYGGIEAQSIPDLQQRLQQLKQSSRQRKLQSLREIGR